MPFIVIEGLDGVGKSLQAQLLAEALHDQGVDTIRVREPGGTMIGEAVRKILKDPVLPRTPMAELLLFLAARAELVKTLIKPSLDEGYVIIADRFNLSTYAYQGEGLGLDVHSIERFASSGVSPTVTILLQASAETRRQRLTYRNPDAFEQRDKAYFERVERFYELAALDPELGGNIRLVSAEGAPEEVHERVLQEVINACNF